MDQTFPPLLVRGKKISVFQLRDGGNNDEKTVYIPAKAFTCLNLVNIFL